MPRNILSTRSIKNWHRECDDDESTSNSNSGDESDDHTKSIQNLRKFSASDMVRIAETRMWPSSSDDDDEGQEEEEEAEEVNCVQKSLSSDETDQPENTKENLTLGHSNGRSEDVNLEAKTKEESCIVNFPDSEPPERKEASREITKNLAAPEAEPECDPRVFSRNQRRSSVFGLLMGKKMVKSNELSLDGQIALLEKRIAKKMKKLDELQLKLQEMKNLNTN